MNSIWKDLLFLQGYLVRKDDLVWRADSQSRPAQGRVVAKAKKTVLACCAVVWPRLAGPR